jgi:hypothetical protein
MRQEAVSKPAGQTLGQPAPRCRCCQGGIASGLFGAGAQRKVWSLEGEQSPWKYRVRIAGNGGTHYGLVGGETPWSRLALNTNRAGFGLVSGRCCGVDGRAARDTDAPSGAHRSRGTDDALRQSGETLCWRWVHRNRREFRHSPERNCPLGPRATETWRWRRGAGETSR